MTIKKSSSILTILVIVILISACSNNKAIIAEQGRLLSDQEAVIAEKDRIIYQLENSIGACDDELLQTRLQCDKKLTLQEVNDQRLRLRERELRKNLAEDIQSKNIEIEKLRGYLTVRVMDKVLFKSGSINILPEGKAILTRIANNIATSEENIHIEGHTDDVPIGSLLVSRIPSNWELSVLRAASVVRFLENNNINPNRMAAVGHSKFKPVAENDSEDNRQLNRRVEIVLTPNGNNIVDMRLTK